VHDYEENFKHKQQEVERLFALNITQSKTFILVLFFNTPRTLPPAFIGQGKLIKMIYFPDRFTV
jgi:hypothetical protein